LFNKENVSSESENLEINETVNDSVEESADNEATADTSAEQTVAETVAPKQIMPTKGVHIDEAEKEAYLEQLRKSKKRKKIITIVVSVLILLLVGFVIFNVAFGGNDNDVKFSDDYLTKSDPQPAVGELGPDGVASILGEYALSYDSKSDLMTVRKKNLIVMRSYPAPISEEAAPGGLEYANNHALITSPVIVGYTKSGIEGGLSLGIKQMEHTKKLNKIKNGLQIIYSLTELECEFCIEFVLTEKGTLEVTIPANGIKEKVAGKDDDPSRMPRLASLTVLPFMCAARQGDNGYFVTPDGSGALTYFDVARVFSTDEYAKRVYGYDDTFDTFNSPDYNNEDISIPVFGAVQNIRNANGRVDHKLTTAFATTGEASAQIIMGNPGVKNLTFYYVAYRFNLREYYYDSISKSGDSYKFLEEKFNGGDMKETIVFDITADTDALPDSDLSVGSYTYVDVALKARDFLKDKWGVDKKVDETVKDLVNLKVLMGSENNASTSMFTQVKVMTTFNDVRDIYNDLSESGVNDVRMSLLGWQSNGYFGNVTDKFDIDKEYGGKGDLEDLLKWAAENDVTVSADNNTLKLYTKPRLGISLRNSVVKEPGTNYVLFKVANSAGVYTLGTEFHYLSPEFFDEKLLEDDIEELKDLGFANVDLQHVGDLLYTDYNPKNALVRQQVLSYYQNWINEYKAQFDEVSVYYGFDYAVKDADVLLDIPTVSSNLFLIDEAIPFMQIVYHGMIDYYCTPLNRNDHPDKAFLEAIEFGCLFSFEITKENTEELKYTFYNDLFKSEYSLLKDDIVNAYTVANDVLTKVRTASITNHYCVDVGQSESNVHGGNVYCTEYDNGYKVYVNYGSADYTVSDGVTVGAMNYLLVK